MGLRIGGEEIGNIKTIHIHKNVNLIFLQLTEAMTCRQQLVLTALLTENNLDKYLHFLTPSF